MEKVNVDSMLKETSKMEDVLYEMDNHLTSISNGLTNIDNRLTKMSTNMDNFFTNMDNRLSNIEKLVIKDMEIQKELHKLTLEVKEDLINNRQKREDS